MPLVFNAKQMKFASISEIEKEVIYTPFLFTIMNFVLLIQEHYNAKTTVRKRHVRKIKRS